MTLQEQTQVYWIIALCWKDPDLAIKQKMSYGRVVQLLRAIIDLPGSPRILVLAQALLDDVAQNSVKPSRQIPTTK